MFTAYSYIYWPPPASPGTPFFFFFFYETEEASPPPPHSARETSFLFFLRQRRCSSCTWRASVSLPISANFTLWESEEWDALLCLLEHHFFFVFAYSQLFHSMTPSRRLPSNPSPPYIPSFFSLALSVFSSSLSLSQYLFLFIRLNYTHTPIWRMIDGRVLAP